MDVMRLRCDGPACRLRAGDCGLGTADGEAVACLRRCDVPVAASEAGRALTVVARGRVEAYVARPLPAQPGVSVVLRDAGFADQPMLAAARRRGAYLALPKIDAVRAGALAAAAAPGGFDGDGAFAARVLCEHDPHLVLEGLAILARAGGAGLRVPAALADAAAEARELVGDFAVGEGADLVHAARVARAARLGADAAPAAAAHATLLCAVSGDVLRPGLYELLGGATIGEALAAAGGVVDGVRVAQPGTLVADGALTGDLAAPAPAALVTRHAGRGIR
jgi:SLBB domain